MDRQSDWPPPSTSPATKAPRRVIEAHSIYPSLMAVTGGVEHNRVEVNPGIALGCQLHSDWQLMDRGDIPDVVEGFDAANEVLSINGQVEVAVIAGLPSRKHGHTPAARRPSSAGLRHLARRVPG